MPRTRYNIWVLTPIDRFSWPAAQLIAAHPPQFRHPNKRAVHDLACPPGAVHSGTVTVTRWEALPLPTSVPARLPVLEERLGFFVYGTAPAGGVAWHQNFADPELFGFYAGGLFAQDEMQVSEHPALASVRDALLTAGARALTVEYGQPTPVLVAGVERRCAVDTAPSRDAQRSFGLYGNRFGAATPAVVRAATRVLQPPTITNLLAMAALGGGRGAYTREDINWMLRNATTGYTAAVAESKARAPGATVTMHTGFWGCGAFGGNRVLMTVLQAVAARLAGMDMLVMYFGDSSGLPPVTEARALVAEIEAGAAVADVVEDLVARDFRWGASDGN